MTSSLPCQQPNEALSSNRQKESLLKLVIIGHVDHGKSTIIGRLLVDTNSIPNSKINEVAKLCEAKGKPFEYSFLLDALHDERAQGITIDASRVFFRSKDRRYIIFDAPGHKEFIKNMVTGAAGAKSAVLVIDANEGLQKNTLRHAYMASFLGVKTLFVAINKMDLVKYDFNRFHQLRKDLTTHLEKFHVDVAEFVPICGRNGENIVIPSPNMSWYKGKTLLELIEGLNSEKGNNCHLPMRFPVQDVYHFDKNKGKILAGTLLSGRVILGDEVGFYPSNQKAQIKTIESLAGNANSIGAGSATGFTLEPEISIRPGELMFKGDNPPKTAQVFSAKIFWLGNNPLVKKHEYKMKIGSQATNLRLIKVDKILDAGNFQERAEKTSG